MHIYDGQPYPTTGAPDYDASAYTRAEVNIHHCQPFEGWEACRQLGTQSRVPGRQDQHQPLTRCAHANGRLCNDILVMDKQ